MLKVATFNVENLFGRAKALNFYDHENGTNKLETIGLLQNELKKKTYDKPKIIELYKEVKDFVKFNVICKSSDVGYYIVYQRSGVWTVSPDGCDDWFGFLEFKRSKFDDDSQKNTAKVIKDMKADVLCLVEVESLPVLKQFNTDRLSSAYPHKMLIDGNDDRGIDVGLYSNYELGAVWTNQYEKNARGGDLFPRDCLEVEVYLPSGESLFLLLNHFTSKYGGAGTDDKRKEQAQHVAHILDTEYDLRKENVVVMGDLNDTPDRPPLQPLLGLDDLYDALEEKIPDPADRWTYYYERNEQIDYLLASKPLQKKLKSAGVWRKGIAKVDELSNGAIQPYSTVTSWRNAASDHGAVWAEFDV